MVQFFFVGFVDNGGVMRADIFLCLFWFKFVRSYLCWLVRGFCWG